METVTQLNTAEESRALSKSVVSDSAVFYISVILTCIEMAATFVAR